jgi:hypothetical protein
MTLCNTGKRPRRDVHNEEEVQRAVAAGAARELECGDDKERFEQQLKKVAKEKPTEKAKR